MTSAAGVTCQVFVDDTRLADTGADFQDSVPTVLAGLEMTWGRDNMVDQPATATCSFTVQDSGGDADFLATLHTGSPVTVWATADLSGQSAPVDVALDGGMEDLTVTVAQRAYTPQGAATYATDAPHAGARSLRLNGNGTTGGGARAYVGPAPFGASDAWDDIPKTATGQTWTVHLAVKAARAARTTVAPWLATSSQAGPNGPSLPGQVIPPGGGWVIYSQTWTTQAADPADTWVGVLVTVDQYVAWRDQPGTWAAQVGTWRDYGSAVVDDMQVLAPPESTRQVLVFSGRITSLAAQSAGDGGVGVQVTCADWTADLANAAIGDQPWLVETVKQRVARILALAGGSVTADLDPFPAGLQVSWVDVDSQPAMDLLSDLAVTSDSVVWSAWHGSRGFYLRYEDPSLRSALKSLGVDPDSGLIVVSGGHAPSDGIFLPSCSIALDPITITQDVTDVVTRVDLTWQEQTLDDGGQPSPTDRHILVVDTGAEAQWGQRRQSVTTQLTSSANGTTVANRIINRSRGLGWHAEGFTWDTQWPEDFTDADRTAVLDLLDGTQRIGAPVVVTDMPAWSPSGPVLSSYLEGGTYRYQGGHWVLELALSPSGQTGASTRWRDLPAAWTWTMFDPGLAWFQLLGTTVDSAGALSGRPQMPQDATDPQGWTDPLTVPEDTP